MVVSVLAAVGSGGFTLLDEHQVLVLLVQLALLVGTARLVGGIANKLRQPAVVGQIIAGVLIGPSVLGKVYPDTFEWLFSDSTVGSVTYGLAWLAVIMVLVVIGYETDLGIIIRLRRAAVNVSAGALLVPLVVVGLVALLTPSSFVGDAGRGLYAAFMALALSVAALPVVAKILLDLGMLRRNFGQVTLAVSMTMDSVGWLILAGLAGIAREGFRPADLLASPWRLGPVRGAGGHRGTVDAEPGNASGAAERTECGGGSHGEPGGGHRRWCRHPRAGS